jgi:hypothetical protein
MFSLESEASWLQLLTAEFKIRANGMKHKWKQGIMILANVHESMTIDNSEQNL